MKKTAFLFLKITKKSPKKIYEKLRKKSLKAL